MKQPLNVSSYRDFCISVCYDETRLDEKTEREMFQNMTQQNRDKLVLMNMRFIIKKAYRFRGYGIPDEDLVNEGVIGLIKSIDKFDPSHGVRFMSYAGYHINNAINDFVVSNFRIGKIATTKNLRKLFFNIRSYEGKNPNATRQQIAQHFNVTTQEVEEIRKRVYGTQYSYEQIADKERTSEEFTKVSIEVLDRLKTSDIYSNPEMSSVWMDYGKKFDHTMNHVMTDRQRKIIKGRFEDEKSLKEIGVEMGLSPERVRQVSNQGVGLIKNAFGIEST